MSESKLRTRNQFARAYAAFFVVASFFTEGTMAAQNTHMARQEIPASSDYLVFISVPNATTCEPYNFTWFYQGSNAPVAIHASDAGVPQEPVPPSTTRHYTDDDSNTNVARAVPTGVNSPLPIVTVLVGEDIKPADAQFTWRAVDVPQGWYQLIPQSSHPTDVMFRSSSFFVSNGSDTTCLTDSSSPPPSSSSSPSSSPISISTMAPTQTSGTPIIVPIGGAATSSSSSNAGLIIGVSIGAVVLVAAAVSAWLWLYRMKQRNKIGAGSAHLQRRWGGLGSTDSRGGFMATDASSRRQHGASTGTLSMSPSEEGVSKAEKQSIHAQSPFDDGADMVLSTLPVLQHRSRTATGGTGVARTYSMSSSISNGLSPYEFGAAATNNNAAASGRRRPSMPDIIFSGRQSGESMNYPPSSPSSGFGARCSALFVPEPALSRSHSLSTSATHQTSMMGHLGNSSPSTSSHAGFLSKAAYEVNSPPSPTSPASDAGVKQAHRRSAGSHKRKPVPAYDETTGAPLAPPVPSLSAPSPPTPSPPTSTTPVPPSPVLENVPHYLTRSQAGRDQSQPELVHKSSFGPGGVEGKPLHYLIPDMPVPLKD